MQCLKKLKSFMAAHSCGTTTACGVQCRYILHEKRKTTEDHIKQLQKEGKQGDRYTAMMPDIPFWY